jgi:hypothetical protein
VRRENRHEDLVGVLDVSHASVAIISFFSRLLPLASGLFAPRTGLRFVERKVSVALLDCDPVNGLGFF